MRTETARAMAKRILGRLGCHVGLRRERGQFFISIQHRAIAASPTAPPEPAKLFHDPMDALYHRYGGKSASFICPIDQCVDTNGLSFGRHGWHPFVATLREYARGEIDGYEGSALQRYYLHWQPGSLLEALPGLDHQAGSVLHTLPSRLTNLLPWTASSTAEADEAICSELYRDYVEHGRPDLTVERDGVQTHGPVSDRMGRLQYGRQARVYHSLADHGYQRQHGDIRVLVVARAGEHRYVVISGIHRLAAMAALDHRTAPATFNGTPAIFDVAEADRWPQVRSGAWSRQAAQRYVDHLFDFDARAWARRKGLIEPNAAPDPGAGAMPCPRASGHASGG